MPKGGRFTERNWVGMEMDTDIVRDLQKALNSYGANALSKVASPAVGKAIRPVLMAMKENARNIEDTGATLRSLGSRRKTYRHSGTVLAMAGQRSSYSEEVNGKVIKPSKIAHILEFGSRRQSATPIQFPAWQSKKTTANNILRSEMKRLLLKQAKKEFAKSIRGVLR